MAIYSPRLECPDESDPHYNSSGNIFTACGYGMFQCGGNCTAYAWGRLYEITGHRYTGLYGNAEKWYDQAQAAGLEVGQEPKLGAIACWMQGDTSTSADGAGHVAVVEEIHDDGSWTASMSGYQHYLFKTVEIGADNAYGGMEFRGFIYCGLEFDEKEAMSMEDAKKLVVCDYAQYLGRMPSPGDIDADSQLIVDQGLSTEQYDYSFIKSQEYHDRSGALAAQDFVIRCYRAFLGRFPESEDVLNEWVSHITSGEMRYRDVAWDIYTGDEAKAYRGES